MQKTKCSGINLHGFTNDINLDTKRLVKHFIIGNNNQNPWAARALFGWSNSDVY